MDLSLQIKTILYSEINNIQEQNIQLRLAKRKSQEVIDEVICACYQKIASIQNNKEESLGVFAEFFALSAYLFLDTKSEKGDAKQHRNRCSHSRSKNTKGKTTRLVDHVFSKNI